MQIDIPYGKEKIKVNISEPYELLVPNKVEKKDEYKIIDEALKKPIDMETFDKFALLLISRNLKLIFNGKEGIL